MADNDAAPRTFNVVVVSAGASDPSSTRLLADRTATRVGDLAQERGAQVDVRHIELRRIAGEIVPALTSAVRGPGMKEALQALDEADGIVVSTPVYSAGPSGIFMSFFQAIDDDLLIAKPVLLTATAGTARHALVIDEQMRALFAYLRALSVPTSVFAASEDWNDASLGDRIDRAALELVVLMESDVAGQIKAATWSKYRHEYGGVASPDLELDSDMMRLAAGGSLTEEDPGPLTD